MATLLLEVDDQTLKQAEEISRATGVDFKRDLANHLSAFVSDAGKGDTIRQRRLAAVDRLIKSADAFPTYSDRHLTADDRNER